MKFILRVIGSWLLALAVIFLVADLSAAFAGRPQVTSFVALWQKANAQSLEAALAAVSGLPVTGIAVQWLINMPAIVVFALPGLIMLYGGRRHQPAQYAATL